MKKKLIYIIIFLILSVNIVQLFYLKNNYNIRNIKLLSNYNSSLKQSISNEYKNINEKCFNQITTLTLSNSNFLFNNNKKLIKSFNNK